MNEPQAITVTLASQDIAITLTKDTRYIVIKAESGTITRVTLKGETQLPITLYRFEIWAAILLRTPPALPGTRIVTVEGADVKKPRPFTYEIAVTECLLAEPFLAPIAPHPLLASIRKLERRSFEPAETGLSSAAEYFLELDEHTHPTLIQERKLGKGSDAELRFRSIIIESVTNALYQLVLFRKNPMVTKPKVPLAHLAYLSGLLIEIIEKHRRPNSDPFDWYTLFGAGELFMSVDRLSGDPEVSNSGPNGLLIFCFAEFAFLAIDNHIHEKEWLDLLPGLVAAQGLYLEVYGSGSYPRKRLSKAQLDAFKLVFRAKPLDRKTLEDRHSCNFKLTSLPLTAPSRVDPHSPFVALRGA